MDVSLKLDFKNIINALGMGIIILDREDRVLFANQFIENILFFEKNKHKSIKFSELCPNLFDKGKLIETIKIKNVMMKIEMKKILNYKIILLKDITEIEKIKKENRILKEVLDSIHEGVQITDEEDVIIFNNKFSEVYEGLKSHEILGKKVVDVYDITEGTCVHRNIRISGEPVIEKYYEFYARGGERINVIASTFPYYENNKVEAVYSINRDVSKIKDFITESINFRKKIMLQENKTSNGADFIFDNIIGESKVLKHAIRSAKKIAGGNSTVLIYGETGTGKELFAQSIHNASIFSDGPFIAINCAAIPETLLESILFGTAKGAFTGSLEKPGLFEQAEGGTLFLDEINSMGYSLQSKLLRVIQEKKVKRISGNIEKRVNCRLIASTNKDPIEAVVNKEIREDLYYRINAITLFIPPLRHREADVLLLIKCFIKKYNIRFGTTVEGISVELKDLFMKYQWPGNVRELEHIIEGALNMVEPCEKTIKFEHIQIYQRQAFKRKIISSKSIMYEDKGKLKDSLEEFEKKIIYNHLKENKYNITKTAEELGISRQSLQYRIKKCNINIKNEI